MSINYRTKVECAGLCLSREFCFGFQWIPPNQENDFFSCQLLKRQTLCKNERKPSIEIYIGENENVPACGRC